MHSPGWNRLRALRHTKILSLYAVAYAREGGRVACDRELWTEYPSPSADQALPSARSVWEYPLLWLTMGLVPYLCGRFLCFGRMLSPSRIVVHCAQVRFGSSA